MELLERLERIDPRWVRVGGLSLSCPDKPIDFKNATVQVDTKILLLTINKKF